MVQTSLSYSPRAPILHNELFLEFSQRIDIRIFNSPALHTIKGKTLGLSHSLISIMQSHPSINKMKKRSHLVAIKRLHWSQAQQRPLNGGPAPFKSHRNTVSL